MFPVGTIVKWVIIGGIISTLAYGLNRVYEYHLDQIDAAVNTVKVEMALEQNELINTREKELRQESAEEKERIEVELKVERAKVTDLKRMLLIDHDLDRLLQRKPGLILPIVNKGTAKYFKELEEITQ